MTVIAYRNGILAADTLITGGGSRLSHQLKLQRVNDWLVGIAGSPAIMLPIVKWIKSKSAYSKPIDFGKMDGSLALVVNPGGVVYHVETENPYLVADHSPFNSVGSGSEAARAAMIMGADALQAVEVAKALDIHCGGATVWLALDGREQLELPKEIYNLGNSR